MPTRRLIRPLAALTGLLGLAACVAPPVVVPPGSVVLSQQCSAGFYQCVLPTGQPAGSPCACPGLGAPSYGVVR